MTRHHLTTALASALALGAALGCGGPNERLEAFLMEPRAAISGKEYRVMPPDMISITSIHVPEIAGVTERIRPDGKINLPLVGEIFVAGHTPAEIEGFIKEAARDYYEQVDATVRVASYNSQMIFVFGQVSRPGAQPWTGNDTLLDILARSQPTQLAWPERIRVVRGKSPTRGGYVPGERPEGLPGEEVKMESAAAGGETDDEAEVMVIDLMKMVKSGDLSHNVLLRPDDMIYVPPNPLAAVGLAIQQVLFPVRPAIETAGLPATAVTGTAMP